MEPKPNPHIERMLRQVPTVFGHWTFGPASCGPASCTRRGLILAAAPLLRTLSPSLSKARSRRLRLRVRVRVTLSLAHLLFLPAAEAGRCGWRCRKGVAARLAGFAPDTGVFEGQEAFVAAAFAEFLLDELGVIFWRPVRVCRGCPGAPGPDVSDGLGGNAEFFR